MFGFDDMGGGGSGGGGGGEADDAFADALEDFDVDSEVVGARHLVLPEGTVDPCCKCLKKRGGEGRSPVKGLSPVATFPLPCTSFSMGFAARSALTVLNGLPFPLVSSFILLGSTVDVAAVSLALIRAFKAFSLHARSMSTSR